MTNPIINKILSNKRKYNLNLINSYFKSLVREGLNKGAFQGKGAFVKHEHYSMLCVILHIILNVSCIKMLHYVYL